MGPPATNSALPPLSTDGLHCPMLMALPLDSLWIQSPRELKSGSPVACSIGRGGLWPACCPLYLLMFCPSILCCGMSCLCCGCRCRLPWFWIGASGMTHEPSSPAWPTPWLLLGVSGREDAEAALFVSIGSPLAPAEFPKPRSRASSCVIGLSSPVAGFCTNRKELALDAWLLPPTVEGWT